MVAHKDEYLVDEAVKSGVEPDCRDFDDDALVVPPDESEAEGTPQPGAS